MEVIILAGGHQTRLKGVWDKPKCLVPVAGMPLLERLIKHVQTLMPSRVTILAGTRDEELLGWLYHPWKLDLYVQEDRAEGTATAIRYYLRYYRKSPLDYPVMVLNGDTLPMYPLRALLDFYRHTEARHKSGLIAVTFHDKYAGACVLGQQTIFELSHTDHRDLDTYLVEAARYRVTGFLDIGTPGDFDKAQHIKGEALYDPEQDSIAR
jgi:bifunctional N-acetylglucosamine-1-phosphate-uridyltransferase/glucosamine-1-phosphate-acetyltransferase GlmU-like protein